MAVRDWPSRFNSIKAKKFTSGNLALAKLNAISDTAIEQMEWTHHEFMKRLEIIKLILANIVLLAIPTSGEARGVGEDWHLVSRDGKLIRKLDWKERDVVDADAGLVYRLEDHILCAQRFEDDVVKWSVQCPVQNTIEGALVYSDPDTLALLARGILHGYDKHSGKEVYRTPLGTPIGTFSLPRNFSPSFTWGINANGEEGGILVPHT